MINASIARYVAGPVAADLDPAAGTELIQLGAFLHPLPPGTHTVRFVGRFVGPDTRPPVSRSTPSTPAPP